jgi:hypothetical protein
MDLNHVTYQGPPLDDWELFQLLPVKLRALLKEINGFVQFGGGLHIRGCCMAPEWHSLRQAWMSHDAFCQFYRALNITDIPFGEDCYGNQFVLRGRKVLKLDVETGALEDLRLNLYEFLEAAQTEIHDFLDLEKLTRFQSEGGTLAPGQLLNVYPPASSKEAAAGTVLTAVPSAEQFACLRKYHSQIKVVAVAGTPRLRALK